MDTVPNNQVPLVQQQYNDPNAAQPGYYAPQQPDNFNYTPTQPSDQDIAQQDQFAKQQDYYPDFGPGYQEPGLAKVEDTQCSFHFRSFLLTAITATFLGLLVYFATKESHSRYSHEYKSQIIIFSIFGGLFYIGYLVECCLAGTRKYLSHKKDVLHLETFMNKIKEQPPVISFSIECYHYETRTRVSTYTDSNGNTQTSIETYEEKVVTFRGSENFYFSSWTDETGIITGLDNSDISRLKLEKQLLFADKYSEDDFKLKRQAFINKHKYKDTHYNESWAMDISGFQKRLLVKRRETALPCCMDVGWYALWSLLLLSWPYRLWFGMLTKGKQATVKKQIQVFQK